jgi:putative transcriptional regulator
MSTNFKAIRERLGMTQAAIGADLGVTQGNVSFYEKGQTVPPDVARLLIEVAGRRGLELTFDNIYGDAALPPTVEEGAA